MSRRATCLASSAIGTVVEVRGAGGASKTVVVRPEVDPAGLEEVLVLLDTVGGTLLVPPEPLPETEPAKPSAPVPKAPSR